MSGSREPKKGFLKRLSGALKRMSGNPNPVNTVNSNPTVTAPAATAPAPPAPPNAAASVPATGAATATPAPPTDATTSPSNGVYATIVLGPNEREDAGATKAPAPRTDASNAQSEYGSVEATTKPKSVYANPTTSPPASNFGNTADDNSVINPSMPQKRPPLPPRRKADTDLRGRDLSDVDMKIDPPETNSSTIYGKLPDSAFKPASGYAPEPNITGPVVATKETNASAGIVQPREPNLRTPSPPPDASSADQTRAPDKQKNTSNGIGRESFARLKKLHEDEIIAKNGGKPTGPGDVKMQRPSSDTTQNKNTPPTLRKP